MENTNTTLEAALIALDVELTGKSRKECEHTARHQKFSDDDFLGGELYYLSDSGLSRVAFDESGELFLCADAQAAVRFNWEYADRAIGAVNAGIGK